MDLSGITLASLLTIPGAIGGAAVIFAVVQVAKNAWPAIDARISGALQATLIATVLYAWAYLVAGVHTGEGGFAAFLAFVTCDLAAIGIHGAVAHIDAVAKGTAGK